MKTKFRLLVALLFIAVLGSFAPRNASKRFGDRFVLEHTSETDLYSLGQIRMAKGDYEGAIRAFDRFLEREPNHVETLRFEFECRRAERDWSAAVRSAERLFAAAPSDSHLALLAWAREAEKNGT